MRRVGLLSLAAAAAFACFLASGAGPAHAYGGGASSPITDPANKPAVKAILQLVTDPAPASGGTAANVQTGMTRARVAAGLSPALRLAGRLSLFPAFFELGWQIGSVPGSIIYDKLTGNLGAPTATATWGWKWSTTLSADFSGAPYNIPGLPASGWVLCSSGGSCFGTTFAAAGSSSGPGAAINTDAAATAVTAGATMYESSNAPGLAGNSRVYVVTEAAMEAKVSRTPITATTYATLPHATAASSFTAPTTLSDANLGLGLAAVGADDAIDRTSTDPAAEQTVDAINHQLDPTYSPHTYVMPNCVGLSQSACTAALVAAGATGTITYVVADFDSAVLTRPANFIITQPVPPSTETDKDDDVEFEVNPSAPEMPVEIPEIEPGESGSHFRKRLLILGIIAYFLHTDTLDDGTYDPQHGPDEAVRVNPRPGTRVHKGIDSGPVYDPDDAPTGGTPVHVTVNPPTAPDVTEPLPAVPPPTGSDPSCNCPPINFEPLTGLDLGAQFPFAIFGYVTGALDLFDVSPVPPGFDIDVSAHGTSAHAITNPGHYTGDLAAFSPYMEIVRTLMTFALWIGALWFVGARMLGFGAAGDLSEAADDGGVV